MTRGTFPMAFALLAGLAVCLPAADPPAPAAPPTSRPAEKLTLSVVRIADTKPPEYLLVLNNIVGYKTMEGLQKHVAGLPPGSSITWGPGCCRMGGEPLETPEQVDAFKSFCGDHKIKLVVIPSG